MTSMRTASSGTQASNPTLRLWPGVALVILQVILRWIVPAIAPEAAGIGIFGGLACGIGVLIWWIFFSRAPWADRLGGVAVILAAFLLTPFILHESVTGGMMGFMFGIYVIPVLSLALVAAAVLTRGLAWNRRRLTIAAAILLASASFGLVRTNGIDGSASSDFKWRWAPTAEEELLADSTAGLTSTTTARASAEAEWPGFRGPHRDGIVPGVRLASDWTQSPPEELWRRPIGPGWSSFAVSGDYLYTQEQRGDDEIVACYRASTGEPVWWHRDAARFWESNAGAGPRATPTLADGRVYTFGATGILNVLDAADGRVIWSLNAAEDVGGEEPGWGFSSSPLVIHDLVIVHAGVLVAYDRETGERRWSGAAGGGYNYSSPHRMILDGVEQVGLLTSAGMISVDPTDGSVLWDHEWSGARMVQPVLTPDQGMLIGTERVGTRSLGIAREAGDWKVEERWTSNRLKPYFNDLVIHKGHAYGFDGSILACIDLENGERQWKGGRYGHGQLVLVPDQDLLLVISEQGDVILVRATPDGFTELARVPAIEGKTWNHPVLVADRLWVRNGREMAAFRLPLEQTQAGLISPASSTSRVRP